MKNNQEKKNFLCLGYKGIGVIYTVDVQCRPDTGGIHDLSFPLFDIPIDGSISVLDRRIHDILIIYNARLFMEIS